jgi:PleD family two-component response regulator
MARNLFETLTVLIVDDSKHMRLLMQNLLQVLGVKNIVMAGDGEEAWSKYLTCKPDVVITDAAMAPTDGFELARRLRDVERGELGHIPIIMISAHTEMSAIRKAKEIGITEFIRKPLAARPLYERLLAVVNRPLKRQMDTDENLPGPSAQVAYL